MARPVLYVLAGVNGAGKSSIGGHLLAQEGLTWYDPDAFARELMRRTGGSQEEATALAWQEGVRRLDEAVANGTSHAVETTLGGHTIAAKILAAAGTHELIIWFSGLASPEQHIRRVGTRVRAGGHDIPEARIRERYPRACYNLIALMPHASSLRVFDNSTEVEPGQTVPDPILVLEMAGGVLVFPAPDDATSLGRTPDWAKPLVEAAISLAR